MSALPLVGAPRMNLKALENAKALLAQAEQRTGSLRANLDEQFIPVSKRLVAVLPHGIKRGSTLSVIGAISLSMMLVAEASKQGAWAAIIGLPEWGVAAAAELGVACERTALIHDPGSSAAAVIAAALDGIDLVLVGPRTIRALTQGEQRRLDSRARERGAVLIACAPWESSRTVITAAQMSWGGIGCGDGYLHHRSYRVAARGRGVPGHSRDITMNIDFMPLESPTIRQIRTARTRGHSVISDRRNFTKPWAG